MGVLGIDPGSNVAGYGLIDQPATGGRPTYLECGTLELRAPARVDRLGELWVDTRDLVDDLRPDVLVVELAHVGINPQSGLAIAEARGVVIGALASERTRDVNSRSRVGSRPRLKRVVAWTLPAPAIA